MSRVRAVQSKKPKHQGAWFILVDDVFVAKTYPEGAKHKDIIVAALEEALRSGRNR